MHNILIVDDEPGIRQSLKGVLEDEGYKASVAESGEACIESLRKRPFDVVLLDVWLPGMDGLDTLEKVREARRRAIPRQRAACASSRCKLRKRPFDVVLLD